ncbi:MAG: LamG-like jellyroll fold domain-containing protein [Chitinophagales bacterium]
MRVKIKTQPFLLVILFTLITQLAFSQWTQKADLGGTKRNGAVGFGIGTKGYIGTGFDGGVEQGDFWEYDPTNNTWTQKANFGGGARGSAVGFSIGSMGYIGTGMDGNGWYSDFYEYDPVLNTWTQKADLPGNNRSEAVGFSIGTKGYIGTGFGSGNCYKDFYEYDPGADTWTQKADLTGAVRRDAVGFSIGAKGYIGTGMNCSAGIGYEYNDFWEYDPSNNTWTQKANFGGTGRFLASGFGLNGKGYLGLGVIGFSTYPTDFWQYDPVGDTWTQQTNFPGTPRRDFPSFAIGTKGYLGTGVDDAGYYKDFWEFSPSVALCTAPNGTVAFSPFTNIAGSTTTINVSYTNGSNPATGYALLRSTTSTPPTAPSSGAGIPTAGSTSFVAGFTVIDTTTTIGSTVAFTATGLASGTQYYYWVVAYQKTNGPCWFTPSPQSSNTATTIVVPATALKFDGVDDQVLISNSSVFNVTSGTIEAWFKTSNAGSSFRGIVVKENYYGLFLTDNKVYVHNWSNGSGITSAATYNDNNWHHVAFVFNYGVTNGSKVFIDGVAQAPFTYNPGTATPTTLAIGNSPGNPQNFNGTIDEVRIWNKALCDGAIINQRNCELGGTLSSDLLAYYKFNQGTDGANNTSITSLTDAKGTYPGSFSGMALTGGASNFVAGGATPNGNTCSYVPLSATAANTGPFCAGGTISVSSSASGGNAAYSYSWASSAGGAYTATGSPATRPSATIAMSGAYNVTVNDANSCTATATTTVTVNAIPSAPTVGTITQPTCALSTGSVALSGLPTSAWTVTATPGGATITGSTATATFSGLAANTYTFKVTLTSSGCISASSANAVINPAPSSPAAPTVGTITQPTCALSTGSVALSGLPTSAWTVTATPGGATITGSTATATFSGLAANTYTFKVTLTSSGCISASSANAVINPAPSSPAAPTVGTITQPTCALSTGSVVLSGLPAGNWTLNPGNIAGSTSSTTVSGLAANTYNYTVTNASGCVSSPSANVVINVAPSSPAAPTVGTITQPTCAVATGSVVLSGLPAGNWTLNPGNIAGSTTSTTVSGLAANTYNYTVTNASGCVSSPSANVVINAQPVTPSAPTVGTITQPTCAVATGSVVLSGLPAGNWTLNPGNIAGSTTSTTVSGLAANTYNYTVTNASGCVSSPSANVVINAQPVTPSAPTVGTITQPTCAVATGSVVLSGLPAGNWTLNPGNIAGSTTSTTVSGLAANTYNYTVTNASGCVSAPSANVVINAQPVTPSAPTVGTITQPSCAVATGSVVLSGLPAGNWTLNPGNIAGSTTSTTVSGLAANTYNYTVTNASGCVSAPSANVVINAAPSSPGAPTVGTITQPSCAVATGSVVLSGLPAGNWTLNPGNIAGSTTSTTVSGLAANTYNYTVTNASGCVSAPSANVVINAAPSSPGAPTVGTITQPSCAVATGSVVLSGLPAGNWTLNPGNIAGSTTSTTVSGLAANTYNYTVTNASGCVSSPSANVVINAAPSSPAAPTVGTITQPTCALSTGSVVLSGLPAGNWTLNPGNIAGSTTSTTVSGLAANTYNYTVTNASGCVSAPSANVVINAQPVTPSEPTVGTITQPTCAVATGSVVLSGLPAGNWTLNPGNIAGSTTSTTVSGLAANTYNYTVTNASGCVSAPSANVVINAQPVTPSAPTVGTITQPSCAVATGSVVLSGLPAGNWTLNPGNIAGSTTSTTVSGLAANTYNYTVTNASGCVSSPSANVVINAAPSSPAAPTVGTITQPTCAVATGSVVLSGLPAGNWTLNPGNIAGSTTSTTVSGLAANTYNYTVTNASGCVSAPSANVVINAQPVTPSAPTVGKITQPSCAVATGSVVLSGLPAGNWTLNPGNIAGSTTSTTVSGLAANTYNYTVTNASGCVSSPSANVVINAAPSAPATPTITANETSGATDNDGIICDLAIVTLSSTAATTYAWSNGGGNGQTSNPFSLIGNTTYSLTVTNASNCSATANYTVTVSASATANAGPALSAICQGSTTAPLGGTVTGGASGGTWSDGGAGGTFTPNANDLNATYTAAANAPASVTLTLTTTGAYCGNQTASKTLTVNPNPIFQFSLATDPITCGASDGTIAFIALNNTTYSITYTKDGNPQPATNLTSNSLGILTITGLSAGTYTDITATFGSCSTTSSGPYTLTNPIMYANAGPAIATICPGGTTANLSGTVGGGATGGIWSDGGAGGTFTPSANDLNATYTAPGNAQSGVILTLTTTGGLCAAVSDNNPLPVYPIATPPTITATETSGTANDGIICDGTSLTLSSTAATTYAWSNGGGSSQTTGSLSPSSSTVYDLTITDGNGCSATASATITVNTPIALTANATDATTFGGNDGAIDLTVTGGNAALFYNWSNNATTEDITGLVAGNYNVTVTAGACSATAGYTVAQPANLCPSSVLYVDKSITISGDGSTWATAIKELADALKIAHQCPNVTQVMVAKGTYLALYYPFDGGAEISANEDRDKTFHLRSNLEVYGGYDAASGTRNIAANPTILSAELAGGNPGEFIYHVVLIANSNLTDKNTLDGFIIQNGFADGSDDVTIPGGNIVIDGESGSGIYAHGGTNTISNNTLQQNYSKTAGGGVFTKNGNNTISSNTIVGNSSNSYGGGICTNGGNNTIINNTISGNSGGFTAGGISTSSGTNLIINNTIIRNSSSIGGGGISTDGGTNTISNNILWENKRGSATNAAASDIATNSGNNTIKNNLLQLEPSKYNAGNYNALGAGAESNLFAIDPNFVDANDIDGPDGINRTADDGARLKVGSPCNGIGLTGPGVPAKDILDLTRDATAPDLGAYETDGTCPEFTVNAAVSNNEPYIGNELTLTATLEPAGITGVSFLWKAAFENDNIITNANAATANVKLAKSDIFSVTATQSNGCVKTASVTVEADLEIMAGFSPPDGQNPVLKVKDGCTRNLEKATWCIKDMNGNPVACGEGALYWNGRHYYTNAPMPNGQYLVNLEVNDKAKKPDGTDKKNEYQRVITLTNNQ